jgi:hypothetical protein
MMSEALFLFLSTLALAATLAAEAGRRRASLWAAVTALLAFLTRSAGLTLVAAMGVWFLTRRPRKEFYIYAALAAVVVGTWLLYTVLAPHGQAGTYGRDLADAGLSGGGAVSGIVRTAAQSAFALVTRIVTWTLAFPTVEGTIADNVAWTIAAFSLGAFGVWKLWPQWRSVSVYLVSYAALMVAWPYADNRLLSVTVPFAFLAILLSVHDLSARLGPRGRAGVMLAVTALLAFGAGKRDLARYDEANLCNRREPSLQGCYDEHGSALVEVAQAARRLSAPGDVIVASKAPGVHFLTERLTVPARQLAGYSEGAVVDTLRERGIRWVILTSYLPDVDGALARAMEPRCNELSVAHAALPNAVLLSVDPPRTSAQPPETSCAAISTLSGLFAADTSIRR